MTEALTNTLKHANADLFRVEIANKNKLLRVEFSDNGGQRHAKTESTVTQNGERMVRIGDEGVHPDPDRNPNDASEKAAQGIGLAGIEERCALCYGRCFFEKREDGFHITMTFPLRSAEREA
jgi:signal transduction histidine kinase